MTWPAVVFWVVLVLVLFVAAGRRELEERRRQRAEISAQELGS